MHVIDFKIVGFQVMRAVLKSVRSRDEFLVEVEPDSWWYVNNG